MTTDLTGLSRSSGVAGLPTTGSDVMESALRNTRTAGSIAHPPVSPARGAVGPGGAMRHTPEHHGYMGRQNRAPLSPVLTPPSTRLRSRSFGNQPIGWSPGRKGPMSPTAYPGGKEIWHGMPDEIKLNTNFPEPPIISENQRAMEAAVQKERARAKAMEKEEENLSADELRTVLKRERHRMARLAADLASMRSMNVQSVAEAEVNEEGRINCLMRRLENLQQEKGRIIVELEREEEMLTNNLQKKLTELRKEKEQLEKKQMSKAELEARLAALKKGPGGDIDMSESLEENEEDMGDEEALAS